MSKELEIRMSAVVANEKTEGPYGDGSFYEGEINGLTVRVVQVNEHVCGYVLLPEGHPWLTVEDDWDIECSVHGGITYRKGGWVGFDTNHYNDVWPDLKDPEAPENLARMFIGSDSPRIWTAANFMTELELLAKEASNAIQLGLDS